MRRLNFDVASDNERRNVRASIDKFLDRLVDEENDRERLRKMLDDLVIACSEESEPGMSQITGREPAMDASIDEIVDRVLNPAHSPLNKLLDGVPNPSRYIR